MENETTLHIKGEISMLKAMCEEMEEKISKWKETIEYMECLRESKKKRLIKAKSK